MANEDRPWVASYDEWVDPDPAIPDICYVDLLEKSFRDFPDRAALHFMGVTQTFGELDLHSQRFASFLAEIGCGSGDVVGICLPNTPQYMIALTGTLRSGCAATGVSPLLAPRELAHQLKDCGARVLVIMDAGFERKFLEVQDQIPDLSHVVVTNIADFLPRFKRLLGRALGKIPTGRIVPVPGKIVIPFMDVLRRYPARAPRVQANPDDTCLIMYTGGTTGLPKGAELTHRNLVAMIHVCANWLGADREAQVYCSAFPFFHMAGLGVCAWSMAVGCTQILIPDPRNTRHICRELARYRPTYVVNVPSLYQMLLEDPAFKSLDASAFERLKFAGSGAAPFSLELIRALEAAVGQGKVAELYGLTETTALVTMNPRDGTKKVGSVGLPIPGTRVKLMDLETGTREVPIGAEGEIIVRGPQVMKGYHNKPEETAHALREFQGTRWLYTGDVGRMDEEGYFYIVDRAKDMIIVGGFKVFSRETEDVLYEHPAVEYCAILGVPNPERPGSEHVKAVIQLASKHKGRDTRELEEEIVSHCRRNMAPYKVPKVIEFVDQIPLTSVGKVDKKALR